MKNFLKSLFGQHKFQDKFPETINVEWNKSGKNYEAIFHKDQLEYIAIFDSEGELVEYKMSLSEDLLPQQIKENLLQKGEIMNAVLKNKGNAISYEVILREASHVRYVIDLNETGQIVQERKL